MQNSIPPYFSYVLRFCPESHVAKGPVWRFSLVDPHSGERVGFGSLEELSRYLDQIMTTGVSLEEPPETSALDKEM